ncbi:MAG TPA: PrgI family protein [Ktedonobacteraceae bacterium]|jgi:hypothetical protein
MRHTIPTLLETKDRILFGLTSKQVLVLCAGLSTTWVAWESFKNTSALSLFLVLMLCAALPTLAACAVAFLSISGQGLDEWLLICLLYLQFPKSFFWELLPEETSEKEGTREHTEVFSKEEEEEHL